MTNQMLIGSVIVLCSLGGWYILIHRYLELKAQLKAQQPNTGPGGGGQSISASMTPSMATSSNPTEEDFNSADYLSRGLGNHVPGMGPPPLSPESLQIPADLLASMKAGMQQKPLAAPLAENFKAIPSTDKREVCGWAAILHLSSFSLVTGILFVNIIVPTILWLLKKDQHPYLAKQGREVINFQITLTFIQIFCLALGSFFIWLFPQAADALFAWTKTVRIVFSTSMYIPFNLFTALPFMWACVMMIRGTVAAYCGLSFKYPYAQPFLIEVKSSDLSQKLIKSPTPKSANTKVAVPKVNFG